MFTRKLVEKEVEVTRRELREVEMYEYKGEEYTKDGFERKLEQSIVYLGDDQLSRSASSNYWLTHFRRISSRLDARTYIQLYDAIKDHVEVLKELTENNLRFTP
jgi:hypothetical protein